MVSGSKQVDDLCCDANIAQEKMESFNKRDICERTMFHLLWKIYDQPIQIAAAGRVYLG